MNKNELRKLAKEILGSIAKTEIKKKNRMISEQVISSELFEKSKAIFIYVSTDNEPDTLRLIQYALDADKTVCVPKCVSKTEMKAVIIRSIDELKEGKFGIKEPADTNKTVERNQIDLAVIPCVAASRSRKRLGHGAGYYDRFLEGMTAYKMCLCFGELLFDDIPTDEHDILMDKIISE